MEPIQYTIKCSKDKFNTLKSDEQFINLLTLARVSNALRFCLKALIDSLEANDLIADRTKINSFFYANSILYEGFLLVQSISKNFKDLDSFKMGFGAILKDKEVNLYRDSILKRMRNKFTFHFDKDFLTEALQNFELNEYNFASGVGISSGEMYFVLADELVINYLLKPANNESTENLKRRYIDILKQGINIMTNFTASTEKLMGAVLNSMGFVVNS